MKYFIVGGGSGLGLELVKSAHEKGYIVGYSTSSDKESPVANIGLRVANNDLRDPQQLSGLIEKLLAFSPDRLVICPIRTRFLKLENVTQAGIFEDVAFNVSSIVTIATAYAKARPTGSIVFLLSHICFLYNPGFTLYKMGKDAVDSFAKSIQMEYPELKVLRVYPGAMKTNFAANTRYSGLSIFPPKEPGLWAERILARESGTLIGPVDFIFMIITRFLPFWAQKLLFMQIFSLSGKK